MAVEDVFIIITCFILIILFFLQPSSQDKLAGFLSGSADPVSSFQSVKERGSTRILYYLTIFFAFIILVLLIVSRVI